MNRNKKALIIFLAIFILVFGYYAISPLFRTVQLDESLPVSAGVDSVDVLSQASVVGTRGHPAEGMAQIVEVDGKKYLRYEKFKTLNGPDLYVYLAKDSDASEFVDLGRLRATEGSVNYDIPAEIDPQEYPFALVWCRAFGVLFNSAEFEFSK